MKDLNVPFSLYDFFAILFPGLLGVIGIYLYFDPALNNASSLLTMLSNVNDFVIVVILIMVSYFLGHIINAIARLVVERPATTYLGWTVNNYLATLGFLRDNGIRGFTIKEGRIKFPKRIFEFIGSKDLRPVGVLLNNCIERTFGKIQQDYGYTYVLIRAFVTQFAPGLANEAKIFSATAAMYESLVITFLLISIAMLRGGIKGELVTNLSIFSIILSIMFTLICFNSSRRYKRMWVETIFAAFMSVVKANKMITSSAKGE